MPYNHATNVAKARKERVCVVGAGMAGLVAMKELLAKGHEVTCYERTGREGGVFTTGVAYSDLRLTVSQHFMCFTSMPPPAREKRELWTRGRYAGYLHAFAERFGLLQHIQFDTEVTTVEPRADGRVQVHFRGADSRVFDAVAICQGAFRASSPRLPRIPGLETFPGFVAHSGIYKDPEPFRGLRALCVGMGETSADITLQISNVTSKCTLCMRTFPEIIKRYRGPDRRTTDVDSTRLFHWMTSDQRAEFYTFKRSFRNTHTMSEHERVVYEWNRRSGGRRSLQKNDDVVANVVNGRIQVRAPAAISRVDGSTVTFDDQSTVEVDAMMFSTGYEESSIPGGWIANVEIPDVRRLYKHAFQPELGRRVALFGLARPRQGGLPVLSELLARYFAQLCSGERELPAEEEMRRMTEEDCAQEEAFFANSKNTRTLVHYTRYADDLAERIGCLPKLEAYLDDPELLTHLVCSSNIGLSYRLEGPDAFPEVAREACVAAPIADPYEAIDRFVDQALHGRMAPDAARRAGEAIRTYLTTHKTDMPAIEDWEASSAPTTEAVSRNLEPHCASEGT